MLLCYNRVHVIAEKYNRQGSPRMPQQLPQFEQARRYALSRLERDLSRTLHYHSVAHTRDDVVLAAERLAAMEGVRGEDLLLLRTAAWFHDLGFVERRDGHEESSVRIAHEVLPSFGYNPEHITTIGTIIMATRIPQSPQSHLGCLLADADLDVLGRTDFMRVSALLRSELAAFGELFDDRAWFETQVLFLNQHHYWTQAARSLRGPQKQQNLVMLEALMAAHTTPAR
jgi:uncharacterized protein